MTKQLSSQAAAAKAIRATLKAAYPTVTFQVRSKSFSMGNDVTIHWTDGPTTKEIDALTSQHEYGHFDGMDDSYHYSNKRDDIPQTKYVMTTRHMSDDTQRALVAYLNRHWGYNLQLVERRGYGGGTYLDIINDAPRGNGSGWQSNDIHRTFYTTSLLCRHCAAATLPGDAYCPQCGHALSDEEAAA